MGAREEDQTRPAGVGRVSSTHPLLIARDGGILRLTLNRPEVGNAIDLPMARALLLAAVDAAEDASVRVVVLTGAGRFFCVGGDLVAFAAGGERLPHLLKELAGTLHSAMSHLARMDKPLITAIAGPAAGAGVGLAVLGDVAIAARAAHFTLAYAALGLSPDGGTTWLLPRLIGLRKAQELAVSNRRVSAADAAAMGLVSHVVDEEEFPARVTALARELAASATHALGNTRALLLSSFSSSFEAQMESEARAIAEASRTPEARERIAAFLARRSPDSKGHRP